MADQERAAASRSSSPQTFKQKRQAKKAGKAEAAEA